MFKRSYINEIPVEEGGALANLRWFVMGGEGGGGRMGINATKTSLS